MTDTDFTVRLAFKNLCDRAKNDAQLQNGFFVEILSRPDLSPDQKVRMISQEIESLSKLPEDFQPREYLYLAEDPISLYNVFIGRLLFFHRNEYSQLRQAVVRKERINHLRMLLYCAKAQLPPFTLPGWMDNQPNVVFFHLNQQPEGTSDQDYFQMKDLENQKKRECIGLASGLLMRQLMEQAGDTAGGRELMHADGQQLGLLFDHVQQWTAAEFMSEVSKLKGLPADWKPLDAASLLETFCLFSEEQWMGQHFGPRELETALQELQRGRLPAGSLFCWALAHYRGALNRYLEGTLEGTEPDDQLLFAQIWEEGMVKEPGRIGEIKNRILPHSGNRKELQWHLSHEMNQLRPVFNQLTHPGYFRLLPEPEQLQSYFVNHCFMAPDRAVHQWQLRKAIEIDQQIRFLEMERFKIHPQKVAPSFHLPSLQCLVNGLLSSMLPDGGLIAEVEEVFARASQWEMDRKPQRFIRKELIEAIGTLCHHAVEKLKRVLDHQPADRKVYFADSQLKELGYLKISAQRDGQELCGHIENVMNIYQLEKESGLLRPNGKKFKIKSLLLGSGTQILPPDTCKVLAFNYKGIKDDKLALVLAALIKLKAISPHTTLPQLRKLFNGMEVTEPLEWWASQGDLMVFIKEMVRINDQEFASYHQHWNIAVRCFVRKGGMAFDPNKLKFSKPTVREQKFIDAARKFK